MDNVQKHINYANSSTLKMVICSSETSADSGRTIRRYVPDDKELFKLRADYMRTNLAVIPSVIFSVQSRI
jgi:hypothetical protein